MNKALRISKSLRHERGSGGDSGRKMPKGSSLTAEKVSSIRRQLESVYLFFRGQSLIRGGLFEVTYDRLLSKSNRVKTLLGKGSVAPDSEVVGARYVRLNGENVHRIVYYLPSLDDAKDSLALLSILEDYLAKKGSLSAKEHEEMFRQRKAPQGFSSYRTFNSLVVDCCYIFSLSIPRMDAPMGSGPYIVTLYRVDRDSSELLRSSGLGWLEAKKVGENTYLLDEGDYHALEDKLPFLISMGTSDLWSLPALKEEGSQGDERVLPPPSQEPIVGVLDGPISGHTYLNEWIESTSLINEQIIVGDEERNHATAVSSLIIDGPGLNPALDDGCGRFRVAHFAIASGHKASLTQIIRNIRRAVYLRPDIKVWNFSWGSPDEVSENSISLIGAELDRLQRQYDVLFILAGTNKAKGDEGKDMRIGSPADSLNALCVNAVRKDGSPASYSRRGPVLTYLLKPDLSYYGGDFGEEMKVQGHWGPIKGRGTSYAAPWMARKAAFLIYKLGFSKEEAKALLIDSALSWGKEEYSHSLKKGFGRVPTNIRDVLETKPDEMRFILKGRITSYKTFTHELMIPSISKDEGGARLFPYQARATLCYLTSGHREQGIDYADTEVAFQFGRIDSEGNVKSINRDRQYEIYSYIREAEARKSFAKWSPVKVIRESIKTRRIPKKSYRDDDSWGFCLTASNRLPQSGYDIPFAIVVTLKEINGKNRIYSFRKELENAGWQVNEVDIDQYLDIYESSKAEVKFD